jgi:hypothetical protein
MGPASTLQTPGICEKKAQLECSYREAKLRSTLLELLSGKRLADRPEPNTGGWALRRIPPGTNSKMLGGSLLHTFENTDAE